MSDAALYHTTAATLASARISMAAAWLLAALAYMAIHIAPFYLAVYAAVFDLLFALVLGEVGHGLLDVLRLVFVHDQHGIGRFYYHHIA